jgi:glycine hydroxymethyltransferase
MHVILAKAVAFGEALQPEFVEYSKQVIKNSQRLAQRFLEKGYKVTTGGTDNHLILIDLRSKGITGKQAEDALGIAGITVNKNMVPYDTQSPMITSGIRIGTPAVTTRGMREQEMDVIFDFIDRALTNVNDENYLKSIREEVKQFCSKFPIYKDLLNSLK